ncbi:hypothetical protein IV203_007582 [Nitzschia inconspicua]|uniref:Uncharacterized protein n=1 Tax=Nitzschia inconspicua TaxID=303405 RepID=A0A9K3KFR9_9STRA|nr:hypothetical protein IV203_007582 [Nitzschia inconspicua]
MSMSSTSSNTTRNMAFFGVQRTLLVAILFLTTFSGSSAQRFCNVCRNPPGGGFRDLANPGKSFTLPNGKTFTCGFMKQSMRDVRVDNMAAPGEKHMCATAQYIVDRHCSCYGTPIPPLASEFVDPNPACRLCAGGRFDSTRVPRVNYNRLTNTGNYGSLNCRGLELALAQGVFPASACSNLRQRSGPTCCNFRL